MAKCLLISVFLWHILLVHVLSQTQTNPSDISALKAFKSLISNSSITPSTCLWSWDFGSSPNPCGEKDKFRCGILCDPSGRVTHLTLDPAGYTGPLSPALSSLSSLISLDLSANHFFGPIPSSLSSLSNLQNLVLRSNKFLGQIPPSILSLTSLKIVDFSENSLTGSLPELTSPNLQELYVSFNNLTGKIPTLTPNLVILALKGNNFNGELTNISFAEASQLEVLDLGSNLLSGTIPPWLFLMQSLQQVNLSNNTFTAIEIPKPTSDSNLVALDLGFNQINGSLPESLSSFPSLAALTVRYNRLSGPIPSGFGKKGSFLKRLFLDGNFLTGMPPEGLSEILDSGSLGDNCLSKCPASSELCDKPQKPHSVCRHT